MLSFNFLLDQKVDKKSRPAARLGIGFIVKHPASKLTCSARSDSRRSCPYNLLLPIICFTISTALNPKLAEGRPLSTFYYSTRNNESPPMPYALCPRRYERSEYHSELRQGRIKAGIGIRESGFVNRLVILVSIRMRKVVHL